MVNCFKSVGVSHNATDSILPYPETPFIQQGMLDIEVVDVVENCLDLV